MTLEQLKQFEVKTPDYDRVERAGFREENLPQEEPARFVYQDGLWTSREKDSSRRKVKLMFTGDLACFQNQIEAARQGDTYDFRCEFAVIRQVFAQADLVVGNLETPTVPQAPYRSERLISEQNYYCNAPVEFLDAVRYAGFDVLTTANNHDLDTGVEGLAQTIDYAERFGFIQTGTFREDRKHYVLLDVHGFKVAITAFATSHNSKHVNLTQEGAAFLLNDYTRDNAWNILAQARAEGAEVVIPCMHWGKEYKTEHNKEQARMARELAEMGYDCIIGSHPHVVQPFAVIHTQQKDVPVFYSLGNFISHNVNNSLSRAFIACVDLTREAGGVKVSCSYIPSFTSEHYNGNAYVVLPIGARAADPGNIKKRKTIGGILGSKVRIDEEITFPEYKEAPAAVLKKLAQKLEPHKDGGQIRYDKSFAYRVTGEYAILEGRSPGSEWFAVTIPQRLKEIPVVDTLEGFCEEDPILRKINFSRDLPFIERRAVKNCKLLEGFQMGRNTIGIREEAFAGCEKLYCAVMRKKLRRIESRAFAGCQELRSVLVPPNVTFIAEDAFADCPKATFYCEPGSYGEAYAKAQGFPCIQMDLSRLD